MESRMVAIHQASGERSPSSPSSSLCVCTIIAAAIYTTGPHPSVANSGTHKLPPGHSLSSCVCVPLTVCVPLVRSKSLHWLYCNDDIRTGLGIGLHSAFDHR